MLYQSKFWFVSTYTCEGYKCGGMEVSLAVYMFLLTCSKLIVYSEGMLAYILWGCVYEVQVNLSSSYTTTPISLLSLQKDTMHKSISSKPMRFSNVINCKL